MNWRLLLLPFSALWWMITGIRNIGYNSGIFPSKKFKKAIIIVGNLTVGGTGKSPHVMYILDLLREKYNVAALSRGYGRQTSGFQIANYDSTASTIGDEPMQFFNRFKNRIVVAVGEDRVASIKKMMGLFKLDAIVLDDAFQHRKLDSDMKILLTDYNSRYSKDWLLPAGNLRESRSNAQRAQIIIVTKCPENISQEEKEKIRKELKVDSKQELFFSQIKYSEVLEHREFPKNISDFEDYHVLAITGIADPHLFLNEIDKRFKKVYELNYPDHYVFKKDDIDQIKQAYDEIEGSKIILTTEKDYMRLRHEYQIVDNLYYLPISIEIDRSEMFNDLIFNYVKSFQRSY